MDDPIAVPSARVLSNFVRSSLPLPVVVLDRLGLVVDENRAAREHAERTLPRLFEPEERSREVAVLIDELRRHGRARVTIDCGGGDGARLLLEGFAVESYFVVMARDERDAQTYAAEIEQLARADSFGVLAGSLLRDLKELLDPLVQTASELCAELPAQSRAGRLASEVGALAGCAGELVRDVLSVAHERPTYATLSVNELIHSLTPLFRLLLGEGIELVSFLDENAGLVRVERARLERALLNLVANARESLPNGGWVSISTASVELERNGSAVEHLELLVSDTGRADTPSAFGHERERALPFSAPAHQREGGALGLASVWRFVEESGGQIELVSEPGQGTTIGLYLPTVTAGESMVRELAPGAADGGGRETLLVLEPEASAGRGIQGVLSELGYRVHAASSVEGALALAERLERPVDLVLSDSALPRLPDEALARLRATNPRLKTLVVSSGQRLRRLDVAAAPAAPFAAIARAIRAALDSE